MGKKAQQKFRRKLKGRDPPELPSSILEEVADANSKTEDRLSRGTLFLKINCVAHRILTLLLSKVLWRRRCCHRGTDQADRENRCERLNGKRKNSDGRRTIRSLRITTTTNPRTMQRRKQDHPR